MINNLDLNVTGEIILRAVLISLFLTISIKAIDLLLENIDRFLERRHIENKSRIREKEAILIETKDDLKKEEFNKLSKDIKYRFYFTPLTGVLFAFPSHDITRHRLVRVFSLTRYGPRRFTQNSSCSMLLGREQTS